MLSTARYGPYLVNIQKVEKKLEIWSFRT